jgi:ABC-2 type transport system permease protein
MKQLLNAIRAEFLKLHRSATILITLGIFIFIPIMMGLLMYVSQHPEISDKLGLIGTKAQFFTENSWKGYLEIINQIIAVLGVIGFAFVTSWIFGREYMDQTITDILALPIKRTSIVNAKFIISFLWCAVLSIVLFLTAILMGKIVDIPGWTAELISEYMKAYFLTSLYIILLNTVIGYISSASKGIVAPLGFTLLMVIIAQFTAIAGWGPYFPWSIPGVFAVEKTTDMYLLPISYVILIFTSIGGIFATYSHWKFADH